MKKMLKTITVVSFVLFGFLAGIDANAQHTQDVAKFLQLGKADANSVITGYTGPIIRGASYGMTGGWYSTAKAHKTLGFDLGVTVTAAFTPSSDQYFTPQLSSQTTFANNTNPNRGAPSIVGPKDVTTYTSTYKDDFGISHSVNFSGPEGLNLKHDLHTSAIPVPMIQAGIGIIKNTDIKLRFIPSVTRNNTKLNMFGIGIMHEIKQWLPGADFLPFDLSVLLAYNSLKGTTTLANADPNNGKPLSSDGAFHYKLKSWVGQAIISKKLAALTGYLGVGYGSVNTNADITGMFQFADQDGQSVKLSDPFATKFKNKSAKLTAGLRLKLGPIYLAGDYTVQKYSALTIGLGVAIR